MAAEQITTIDRFLGVNKSATETLLQLGESSLMTNWMITDDSKLNKQYGYAHLFATLGAHSINGMWYGEIQNVTHFLFSCNGHVYEHNLTTHANTDLGAIADSQTTIFANNNTVYILDGTNYYKWTGTGSISAVVGYTPTVATASVPTGGGTLLEAINYLTGQKSQKFSGNGTSTVYQLLETNLGTVDSVYVGGVLKTVTTHYTVSLVNGTVTFVTAPITGVVNNVVITWTKVDALDRPMVTNCRYTGGTYYSRLWLYGNQNHKNTRFVSGVTIGGVSDPEFFPKYSDSDVGEYEITAICTQYDKQVIYTSGDSSEASAWYSTSETYTDSSGGIVQTIFPVYPINSKIGNIAPGQVQIVLNNPFTLWKGIYEWQATQVINEKNAVWISKRIQADLDQLDLSQAITIDWNERGLYLLCVGSKVWALNYRVNAWYVLELAHTPTTFCAVDGKLCFGTTDGYIMQFDETIATYDGVIPIVEWEMGFHNFGVDFLRKFIQEMFISILPYTTTHVDIWLSTDRNAAWKYIGTVKYGLSGFDTWDFDTFSFQTNYSPQPFRKKLKAKKINYMKIKLISNGDESATVLSMTFPTMIGGKVKNGG